MCLVRHLVHGVAVQSALARDAYAPLDSHVEFPLPSRSVNDMLCTKWDIAGPSQLLRNRSALLHAHHVLAGVARQMLLHLCSMIFLSLIISYATLVSFPGRAGHRSLFESRLCRNSRTVCPGRLVLCKPSLEISTWTSFTSAVSARLSACVGTLQVTGELRSVQTQHLGRLDLCTEAFHWVYVLQTYK